MHPALAQLQPYPFERLAALRVRIDAGPDLVPIDLSIGEPKHASPALVLAALQAHLADISKYPVTRGSDALRLAIAEWLARRFRLPSGMIAADKNILPVNGTREALFAVAQCVVDRTRARPTVLMPNPFYQIYEGAAILAGAQPWFLNCTAANGFQPDFGAVPDSVWQNCQLLYICSPGNPAGNVLDFNDYATLFDLADRHDFVIAADECYSEIYRDEADPPLGLLQAAATLGRQDCAKCLVFHSLSKRSNVPGLRTGFVAGDAAIIASFLRYRTYHGCAMPGYVQAASAVAWSDEAHVCENRALYNAKYEAVSTVLREVADPHIPAGGFYLWIKLPVDDVEFARGLMRAKNVTVLPGSFLARIAHGLNPGSGYVRIALVASLDECLDAAHRISDYINQNHRK
jgi:N-succinyldiaminopimelate aminotransferase